MSRPRDERLSVHTPHTGCYLAHSLNSNYLLYSSVESIKTYKNTFLFALIETE